MNSLSFSRRSLLGVAWTVAIPRPSLSAPSLSGHGRVLPPVDLPAIKLTLSDGTIHTLQSLVRGHATAIQLMFPQCRSTCPIGAATFSGVQAMLPDQATRDILLLSIDVGPFHDTPATLQTWLGMFGARPGWVAAIPDPADLSILRDVFGSGLDPNDPHSDRIQIIDRTGQLVWRTYELPSAQDIVSLLKRV